MNEDVRRKYRLDRNKGIYAAVALFALAIGMAVLSLSVSQIGIGVTEAFDIFMDAVNGVKPEGFDAYIKMKIVYEENGPRAVGAICAGAVLSASGAVLQNIIRNPLADPYTLGISSGALFGMVVSVVFGFSIVPFLDNLDGQIVNAFLFALVPTAVVVFIAAFKKVSPTMMILCGIAVMYIFSAMTTMIKYTMEPETLAQIYAWSIGSVSGLSWGSAPKLVAAVLVTMVPLMLVGRRIDIVAQGDNGALTLGVDPNRLRVFCLVVISVGTAIIVCYTGTIGFVGLVAPHIARVFVGADCRGLILCSAAVGSVMVLGSDMAIRALAPSLPVGVMVAMVCSPVFIFILARMKRSYW